MFVVIGFDKNSNQYAGFGVTAEAAYENLLNSFPTSVSIMCGNLRWVRGDEVKVNREVVFLVEPL